MAPLTDRILALLERSLTSRDPKDGLRALTALRLELDQLERRQVARALDAGDSFGAIADAIGISRQAAHRRYRNVRDDRKVVIVPEARAVLQRARAEAGHVGSATVTAEHLRLALVAGGYLPGTRTPTPPGVRGPGLDPALRDRLVAGQQIGLAELMQVAARP